jgi:hypothetical protein
MFGLSSSNLVGCLAMISTGIGFHDARVDGEPFALDQAGRHARGNKALKELPKDITLSKAAGSQKTWSDAEPCRQDQADHGYFRVRDHTWMVAAGNVVDPRRCKLELDVGRNDLVGQTRPPWRGWMQRQTRPSVCGRVIQSSALAAWGAPLSFVPARAPVASSSFEVTQGQT